MGLFEKIEFERIEPEVLEETEDLPQSSRRWTDETLTVAYQPIMKGVLLLSPLLLLPVFQGYLEEGFFAFEVLAVIAAVFGAWYVGDCVITRDFTFSPDRIVKRGFFGRTVLPVSALVMTVNDQDIRLFHGTVKNIRESVRIRGVMTTTGQKADIRQYAKDVYHASMGDSVKGKSRTSKLALVEFQKAASSYRTMIAFFGIYALIAVFTVGLSERFTGLTPALPASLARFIGTCLAIGGFFLLRWLSSSSIEGGGIDNATVMARLQKADRYGFISAMVACGVGSLGLVLFLMFGNMLDFYLFLLAGILYFFDFYPRLSTWEVAVSPIAAAEPGAGEGVALPRRSLHVSLVLMGALAVLSYGETRHYVYGSRQDCVDDWGDGKDCRQPPVGSTHYGTRYYYGPRYGSGGSRTLHSVGVGTISRGGFGSLGSFHASFGG